MIQNILLATDGSSPAQEAADFAASLALRFQAGIVVLNAFTPTSARSSESHPNRTPHNGPDEARALVEAAARRLRDMGIPSVDTEVVEGPAANVILGVAESRKPDLIVMGARGASTWQGRLLGSVSLAVTLRAECPVLVVK